MGPLERLAGGLQASLPWPHASRDVARTLPRAVAKAKDAAACDVLLALEWLAPQPLAGFAALERDRLEAEGVAPRRGDDDRHAVARRLRAATITPRTARLLDRALPADLAAFAAQLEHDDDAEPELREHGPCIAHSVLEWKLTEGDRRPDRWTLGDLRELMLDWFPRSLAGDEEAAAVAADAVTAFLHFLASHDRLDAPVPLASLESAVARLRPRFQTQRALAAAQA